MHTKSLGNFDLTPLPEAVSQTSGPQTECATRIQVAVEFWINLGLGVTEVEGSGQLCHMLAL